MNRKGVIGGVVLLLAAAVGGILWYRQQFLPKYRWNELYRRQSDQPYGLRYFYSLLEKGEQPVTLLDDFTGWPADSTGTHANFLSFSSYYMRDSTETAALFRFVKAGGRALIATDHVPTELLSRIVTNDEIHNYTFREDTLGRVRFYNDAWSGNAPLVFNYQYLKDTLYGYHWGGFTQAYFDTLAVYGLAPLATVNDSLITAYSLDYGKGRFIFHANPVLFTNYHLARPHGYAHASNFLSLLNDGPVFWDDPRFTSSGERRAPARNPLRYLFSHPHLAWAWYVFLITVLLYLIFRSRREQRIIPIAPVYRNTTVDFVKAVGTLYFKQAGHAHIATELYTLFLADLRARYQINTDVPEEELVKVTAARSGVDPARVTKLFDEFRFVKENKSADSDHLIHLQRSITRFNQRKK